MSVPEGHALAQAQEASRRQRRYFQTGWAGDLFTHMHCLRRFEDVLMDVQDDTPEMNRLADRLMERSMAEVRWWLAVGVDAISVGDDFGMRDACFSRGSASGSFSCRAIRPCLLR